MNDFVAHIAEVEGIKTPTKTRTREDLTKAFDSFTEKRKSKKAMTAKAKTTAKTEKAAREAKSAIKPAVKAESKPATKTVKLADPIPMNFISPTGFVREAAFDPATKLFHVNFAKSTWAFPATPEEWETFEKAVADPLTEIDKHYRKAFRGRGADMIPVRKVEVSA